MRVVIDTNIIVSGLNFSGREREVLELARVEKYELYLSIFILDEVADVLRRKFDWSPQRTAQIVRLLRAYATVVEPRTRLSVIRRDDQDNRILECALEARAEFLLTGDRRDLLPLKEFEGIRIVSSLEFLSALKSTF